MEPQYLELRMMVAGEIPPTTVIIYAELTDFEKQSESTRPEWDTYLRAKPIVEKAGLLNLLPEGGRKIGIPESRFVQRGIGDAISEANARKAKDGRKAWIWME
jgi:hypothetical protein